MTADMALDGGFDASPERGTLTNTDAEVTDRRSTRRGEESMVPRAEFRSYYGKPILNPPVWKSPDVPAYLFLGGLAGGSSLLAAGANLSGLTAQSTRLKVAATAAIAASGVALVHDLGRPTRAMNMLRTFKTSSPMSMGSWLLAAYGPAAAVAAAADLTRRAPRAGATATVVAAALGAPVAAYTAALLADTAVPAWHAAYRELPFVFVGSAATAAGGIGLLLCDTGHAPARRFATLGWLTEAAASERMERRLGMLGDPYREGTGGRYMKAGKILSVIGIVGAHVTRRRPAVSRAFGIALLAASVCTRFGVFHAGRRSAEDPQYTVVPQRDRRERSTDL